MRLDDRTIREALTDSRRHGVRSFSMHDLLGVVRENFPAIVEETEIVLSVFATLLLKDQKNPVALNLEGPPSSSKTTIADFFAAGDRVYRSDKFTPKSFVSHSANVKAEKLAEVDLLPRIRHKLLVVAELAPLFGLRSEDLLDNFTILTRVLDGDGLQTDSGVHGRRGYEGDYLFAWLGCTTPIPHRVWETMGKLGSRMLFIAMPDGDLADDDLVNGVVGESPYIQRVEACKAAVSDFLEQLWTTAGGVRGIEWNRSADPRPVVTTIAQYAKLLARGRGVIRVWREGSEGNESYNFTTPVIEQPRRAMSLLYALARGHAIIHGRTQLTGDDLPIVRRVALESVPYDRRAAMRLFVERGGSATTSDLCGAIGCSAPTARAIFETMEKLGIGRYHNPGPPNAATLTLDGELRELFLRPLKKIGRRADAPVGQGVDGAVNRCEMGLGEAGFLTFVRSAYRAGHLTREEWLARVRSHGLCLQDGALEMELGVASTDEITAMLGADQAAHR